MNKKYFIILFLVSTYAIGLSNGYFFSYVANYSEIERLKKKLIDSEFANSEKIKEEVPKIINDYQKLMPEGYVIESNGKKFRYKKGSGLSPYDYSSAHDIEEGPVYDAWRDFYFRKLKILEENIKWEIIK